jgi:hypothetical protein
MAEIAALDDLRLRFGTSTPRRQFLFRQLDIIIDQLRATRKLKRVFLFGSFLSGKASPNDVDFPRRYECRLLNNSTRGESLRTFPT